MSEYLHGAYSVINANGERLANAAGAAVVALGTAPVHTLKGGAKAANTPIVVRNMAEAKAYLGYDADCAKYTLCEVMKVFFDIKGVGPVIFINALDPATNKSGTQTTVSKTPSNKQILITSADSIILDSVEIYTTDETPVKKVLDTDYTISYNPDTKTIVINEIGTGLGTDALNVKYYTIDITSVTASQMAGSDDGDGTRTGACVIQDVYQKTGYIPAYIIAPGWSENVTVHGALYANSLKINGHWDAFMFTDIPIHDGTNPVTMATAHTWKESNGYNKDNEKVYFPVYQGTDGVTYHLSTLAAANFLELLSENDDIPFHTDSNTLAGTIRNLYLGTGSENRIYDDRFINENLNKYGICSAIFMNGSWRLWGVSSASYNPSNITSVNVCDTTLMMLFYLGNRDQALNVEEVDKPMTANRLAAIVADKQEYIDHLIQIGALYKPSRCYVDANRLKETDIMQGDFGYYYDVTPTLQSKSITVNVTYTTEGITTFIESFAA